MGAGAAKRLSAVRWGVAGNIAIAWALTLPASAAVGGLTYAVVAAFGTHSAGPIVVSVILLSLLTAALIRRVVSGRTLTAEGFQQDTEMEDAAAAQLEGLRGGPGEDGQRHVGFGLFVYPVADNLRGEFRAFTAS